MNLNELKVGDTVAIRQISRRNPRTHSASLLAIGNKYFTVNLFGRELKFHKDTGFEHTDYSPDYQLFATMQDIKDAEQKEQLESKLRSLSFRDARALSLDQLKRIAAILDENQKPEDAAN